LKKAQPRIRVVVRRRGKPSALEMGFPSSGIKQFSFFPNFLKEVGQELFYGYAAPFVRKNKLQTPHIPFYIKFRSAI